MEELPRTTIRKKPRPKQSPKAARPKKQPVLVEATEPELEPEPAAHDGLAGLPGLGGLGGEDFTDVMEDMMVADFAPTAGDLQLPQFSPECAPRSNKWTAEEDALLKREAGRLSHVWGKWGIIAQNFPGRSGKQCRERWHNCVGTHISSLPWTAKEDLTIQMAVRAHGHKWTLIASKLEGRTDNSVKNRYHTLITTAVAKMHDRGVADGSSSWSDEAFLREITRRNAAAEKTSNPARYDVVHKRRPTKAAKPDPEPEAPLEAVAEPVSEPVADTELVEEPVASLRMIEQLANHANDPNLHLLAIEEYCEGTDGSWINSSVLVVGKPGLSFAFAPRGKTARPPPPQADVIASPVLSATKTTTAERWAWIMHKEGDQMRMKPGDVMPEWKEPQTKGMTAMKQKMPEYYKQKKLRYTEVSNPLLEAELLAKTVFA
jgi:hypothetical protein